MILYGQRQFIQKIKKIEKYCGHSFKIKLKLNHNIYKKVSYK